MTRYQSEFRKRLQHQDSTRSRSLKIMKKPLMSYGKRVVMAIMVLCMTASCETPRAVSGRCEIRSLTLINGDTDEPIAGYDPIPSNAVISVSKLPTRRVNILANLMPDDCAVRVDFQYADTNAVIVRESPPFAMYGQSKSLLTRKVDYVGYPAFDSEVGKKRELKVTPYSKGFRGKEFVLSFEVVK